MNNNMKQTNNEQDKEPAQKFEDDRLMNVIWYLDGCERTTDAMNVNSFRSMQELPKPPEMLMKGVTMLIHETEKEDDFKEFMKLSRSERRTWKLR